MKVIQTVSGCKTFVDFAVTKDENLADIYSMSCSVLDRENIKENIEKYLTITESDVNWKTLKRENGKQKVSKELFDVISAFLTGSARGRCDSTFESNETQNEIPVENYPRVDIIFSIDTRLANDLEYQNIEELTQKINENQQKRRDRFDEWARNWESMTPEQIEDLNQRYEEEIQHEQEQEMQDDPDYEPSDSEDDSETGSSSEDETTETDSDTDDEL